MISTPNGILPYIPPMISITIHTDPSWGCYTKPGSSWPRDPGTWRLSLSSCLATWRLADSTYATRRWCAAVEIHRSLRHPKEWDFSMDLSQLYHDKKCGFKMIYHDLWWFIMIYHDLSWFIMIYPQKQQNKTWYVGKKDQLRTPKSIRP